MRMLNNKDKNNVEYECFNTPMYDGVRFDSKDIKNIPIERIFNIGYELGIEHRPIRRHHVEKVVATYQGYTNPIRAVYIENETDLNLNGKSYHFPDDSVVTAGSQHHFEAVKIADCNVKSLLMLPAKRDGKYLDICNKKDRDVLFRISFSEADSQERNCFADTVFMIKKLSDEFLERNPGKLHGVIDYVFESQYGSRRVTKDTIKVYRGFVQKTEEVCKMYNKDFFKIAQEERWVQNIWDFKLEGYELGKGGRCFDIHIPVSMGLYYKLRDQGLLDKIKDVDFLEGLTKLSNEDKLKLKNWFGSKIKKSSKRVRCKTKGE